MPSGFVSTRRSPGRAPAFVSMRSRVHAARDGEAVLQLVVHDGVATDDVRARLVHLVLAAAQDLGENLERQLCRSEMPTMFSAVSGSPPIA